MYCFICHSTETQDTGLNPQLQYTSTTDYAKKTEFHVLTWSDVPPLHGSQTEVM